LKDRVVSAFIWEVRARRPTPIANPLALFAVLMLAAATSGGAKPPHTFERA
jgi:hypothetical protein